MTSEYRVRSKPWAALGVTLYQSILLDHDGCSEYYLKLFWRSEITQAGVGRAFSYNWQVREDAGYGKGSIRDPGRVSIKKKWAGKGCFYTPSLLTKIPSAGAVLGLARTITGRNRKRIHVCYLQITTEVTKVGWNVHQRGCHQVSAVLPSAYHPLSPAASLTNGWQNFHGLWLASLVVFAVGELKGCLHTSCPGVNRPLSLRVTLSLCVLLRGIWISGCCHRKFQIDASYPGQPLTWSVPAFGAELAGWIQALEGASDVLSCSFTFNITPSLCSMQNLAQWLGEVVARTFVKRKLRRAHLLLSWPLPKFP